MHPNPAFRWPKSGNDHKDADERAALEAMIADIGFGMVFAETAVGPRVAHVPLYSTGRGAVQFHLARGNGLTKDFVGKTALCVINGPDAYISPDWYGLADQVPTWNYVTLELEGKIHQMEREQLVGLLDNLTAQNEAKLAPKEPWQRAKMDANRFDKMVDAIVGFELEILAWRPTVKMGQDKPAAVRNNAADALEAVGRKAVAHLMRGISKS